MKKFIGISVSLVVFTLFCSLPVFAGESEGKGLLERITRLEERVGEGNVIGEWAKKITLGGVIEVEGAWSNSDFADPGAEDEDATDLSVATVELAIDADISKYVSGHILFLYEEGEGEDIVVDEAIITIGGGDMLPLYLTAGRMYVPFGNFESGMISDPLTLELGETRETAVQVGFERAGIYGSVYSFNGDVDEDGEDSHIDNFGANLGYAMERRGLSLDVGVSWINNMVDSDGWSDLVDEQDEAAEGEGYSRTLKDYVPGIGLHAVLSAGSFTLIGEYVAALEEVEWNLSDINPGNPGSLGLADTAEGIKPSSWNVELDYTFEVAGRKTMVGVAYQGTDDFADAQPEERYLGVVSVGILDNTTLSLEYFHDEFENEDEVDQLTTQLAVAF